MHDIKTQRADRAKPSPRLHIAMRPSGAAWLALAPAQAKGGTAMANGCNG
jgi:hypothetical protein